MARPEGHIRLAALAAAGALSLAAVSCSPSGSSSANGPETSASAAGPITPGTSASAEAPTSSTAVNGPFPAPTTQGGLQQLITFEAGYYNDRQLLDAAAPYGYVKMDPDKLQTFQVTTPGGTSPKVGYEGTLFAQGDTHPDDAIPLIATGPNAKKTAETIAEVASGAVGTQELVEMAGTVVKVKVNTKEGVEEVPEFDATDAVVTPTLITNFPLPTPTSTAS